MMNYRGKRLLILAGADVHCKVVEAAKEMGVYTVVTDYLENSPAKRIADESLMYSILDVDGIVDWSKNNSIDGVLNFCNDPAQKPYQQICERLGLPCYGTKEQFEILTDKVKFKNFCITHSVDVIPEYSEDDIMNDLVQYPILIKPSDSRGSRGQTICRDKSNTDYALLLAKHESSDNNVIIEKYMTDMQDFALGYLVINTIPYLLKIGDRTLGNEEDGLSTQHMLTVHPSKFSDEYLRFVEPRVCDLIKALGVKFGPIFLQGFFDAHGKTVYFYDPGMRFPGANYEILVNQKAHFNVMQTMIRFALSGDISSAVGDPSEAYLLGGGYCILMSIAVKAGVIKVIDGVDKLRQDKRIISIISHHKVGDEIFATRDIKQRVIDIEVFIENRNELHALINDVYHTLSILDSSGNDMVISKVDVKQL